MVETTTLGAGLPAGADHRWRLGRLCADPTRAAYLGRVPEAPIPEGVFDTTHYAATPGQKLRRAAALGGRYYFMALPRYLRARRRAGLGGWDAGALTLPLRELRRRRYDHFPLPPGYPDVLAALRDAGVRISMPRLRLEALLGAWWSTRDVRGDDIECGAYRGATGLALAALAARNGIRRRVLLLDTFAGVPAGGEHDALRGAGDYDPGAGWARRLGTQAAALGIADRIDIHEGLFAETFAVLERREGLRFAFVHVDANVYEGTRDACRFTLRRLSEGGVAVFDDYHGVLDLGARLAVDECLGGRVPAPLAWTSAYVRG